MNTPKRRSSTSNSHFSDKVYSSEEIIERYGHVIERVLQEHIHSAHRKHIDFIDAICESAGLYYDWKNSPEGFVNWLDRMVGEGKVTGKMFDVLLKHWVRSEEADCEWQSVYYDIKHIKAK